MLMDGLPRFVEEDYVIEDENGYWGTLGARIKPDAPQWAKDEFREHLEYKQRFYLECLEEGGKRAEIERSGKITEEFEYNLIIKLWGTFMWLKLMDFIRAGELLPGENNNWELECVKLNPDAPRQVKDAYNQWLESEKDELKKNLEVAVRLLFA